MKLPYTADRRKNPLCTGFCDMDAGPYPGVADLKYETLENNCFRTAFWTGTKLQVTLMSLLPGECIGVELHPDTDQLLVIEKGNGIAEMGVCRDCLYFRKSIGEGSGVFVPAGTWHNIINTGRAAMKLFSVYAPPNHPHGTIHPTKADAERSEY